ncbi:BREX-1 system adenine-specific DNA-methyltransferase PglX [Candidatus Accumulibacter sp. ACC012]|uniref:BREX-1 system adenine-specific DNA-methyltransferase PglX n=1 Tax=Candidatus Accumulibacter sp. ACC012 TaxID=2823332 RepID=UPI0025BA51EE|nr:BREX-1 system adenine-specific DNA-methyltransferase PglX [Candidatus Accumulibacter sp. ACC012]
MAFDQSTRNRLQRFVNDARQVQEEEFTRQLQNDYGLDPTSGTITPLENLRHLNDAQRETARILRDTLAHYCASQEVDAQTGLERIVREQAFTVLNRLAALRMAEARGLLIESVGNGYQAKGFQLYARLAGTGLGETGDAYRVYLFSVFDELAQDLPGLFDRYSPQGRLFPRESSLLQLLALINDAEIEPLWAEDETIGWIYQYFNSKEERKAMRDASQAPRNSRELAVRNQFFTPRYVVEFLVDNTLGRLWFNATGGKSALAGRCHCLLMKPDEQPVAASRLRDPRTLKLLDPACGSMHFGLYAFDLFLEIYREAWDWEQEHGPGSLDISTQPSAHFKPLNQTYADHASFLRDVPRLIIEHNIYGVDIDPRAAQIASLALWLRAQRAWHQEDVKAKDRPLIGRGHVVAAIAPPAERELRQQFVGDLDHLDAELFEKTLQLLKGLPELGVLLQIERELRNLIRQVFGEHGSLFKEADLEQWQKAEARLRMALTEFTQAARSNYQGRLFAQDALEGLRLIDLTRERFDVVVMNPPFGEPSENSKDYVFEKYPVSKYDLAATFWERATQVLNKNGLVGCLANRTIFFGQMLENWRKALFIENGTLDVCLDLGLGVLDSAMVEAMASVSRKSDGITPTVFIKESDAPETVGHHIEAYRAARPTDSTYKIDVRSFSQLPGFPFSYWIPEKWLAAYSEFPTLESQGVIVKQGMESSDNFRFVRLWWEPSPLATYWKPYSKGGSFGPQWRDIDVSVNWKNEGGEVKAFSASIYGTWTKQITNSDHYGKPGIVYPASRVEFSPRIVPSGNVIGCKGPIVLLSSEQFTEERYLRLLAIISSSSFRALVNLTTTSGDTMRKSYREKAVAQTPAPNLDDVPKEVENIASRIIGKLRELDSGCETKRTFSGLLGGQYKSVLVSEIRQMRKQLDSALEKIYGFRGPDYLAWLATGYDDLKELEPDRPHDLIAFLVGCAFGRWPLWPISEAGQMLLGLELSPFEKIPSFFDSAGRHQELVSSSSIAREWPGIIPLDEDHPNDICRMVSSYLDNIFGSFSSEKEHHINQALGTQSIREYLRRDSGFFDAHLTQYSLSRRQAPIYWPIATSSNRYALWLYYPSLSSQTLYTAINDFVEPKLKQVVGDVAALRNKGTARSRDDEKQFETLQAFELELIELRDTLLGIAQGYQPNHDDGVQITAAPLWPLFRHKPWQKVLKDTWAKLEKGDYDWAHLAMSYWPARVREKCKTDKSLAIAHDMEALYVEPEAKPKKTRAAKGVGK